MNIFRICLPVALFAATMAINCSSVHAQFSIKNTPFDTKTWRADSFKPKLKDSHSRVGGPSGPVREMSKIWIYNEADYPIKYSINGKSFTVRAKKTNWHRSYDFKIQFDSSFAKGYQKKSYSLSSKWKNYVFKPGGSEIYFYHSK